MLYLLLYPYSDHFPVLNVLRYPSFRMLAAGIVSLLAGMVLGPTYIETGRRNSAGPARRSTRRGGTSSSRPSASWTTWASTRWRCCRG